LPLTLERRDPRTGGPDVEQLHITHELIDPNIKTKRARYRDKDGDQRAVRSGAIA